MKFELKNIKYSDFASEETNCFQATLYKNGKRFSTVSNDGKGGCDNYYPFDEKRTNSEIWGDVVEINKELNKEKIECSWDKTKTMGNDLEIVVSELLADYLVMRDVKIALKRRVCYKKSPKEVGFYQLAAKFKPTLNNLMKIKKAPWWTKDCILLNEIKIEDAAKMM